MPYPKPHSADVSRFFEGPGDYLHLAFLHVLPDPIDAFEFYARGYKEAAEIVTRTSLRSRRKVLAYCIVFPVVFLWRQYVELRLKELIHSGRHLLGQPPPQKEICHHDIGQLWDTVRVILSKSVHMRRSELTLIEPVIREWKEIDPFSMAFRYPHDRKGKPSAPDVSQINLRKFGQIMKRLSKLLENASTSIGVGLDAKREADAAAASYAPY